MSQTKSKILTMLFQHQNAFISGQRICDDLGCSRTAVWKHMKELRSDGYIIESVPNRGYKLVEAPNVLSAAEVKADLQTRYLGHSIQFYETTPSTQKIAHHIAEDGAKEGTLVLADQQTGGRGRLGRPWHSPKGTGIWMSLILRPKIPLHQTPQLTLLAAVAVIRAIHQTTGIQCGIKWPNDILYKGKKLVGILTELQAEEGHVRAVIVGMGMNVNTAGGDLPDELKHVATALKEITGHDESRAPLIQRILLEFETLYDLYLNNGFQVIKGMWESYAVSLGKKIYARSVNGEMIPGIAKGINDEGVLLLEGDDGQEHHIYSADIQIDTHNS